MQALTAQASRSQGVRGKGDYTVCIVISVDYAGLVEVVRLYRARGTTFERRYADICDRLKEYRPRKTLVEANDGLGQTFEENIAKGCPGLHIERFINNQSRKAYAINKIQLALERDLLCIPKSPIINELLAFQIDEAGVMGAVGKDVHDDTVMALGIALVAADYEPVQKYPDIPRGQL